MGTSPIGSTAATTDSAGYGPALRVPRVVWTPTLDGSMDGGDEAGAEVMDPLAIWPLWLALGALAEKLRERAR